MSWPTVKLGDICDLFNGYAFKSKDYIEESNTLSCRMSNIRPRGKFDIEYNARYLPDDFAINHKQFLLKDGDVVIAMTDLAGAPKILGVPTVIKTNGKNILLNQRVGKLVIKDDNKVYFPYLQRALNCPKVRSIYKRFAGGGLQINLGKADLLSVELPLPPLSDQKSIAAILDVADRLRQKDQQLIEQYNALSHSLFSDMFGDPVGTEYLFKDLADKSTKGTFSNGPFGSDLLTSELTSEGVPVIYIRDIAKGSYIRKKAIFVTKEKADSLINCQIKPKDILISKVGTPPGVAAIYPDEEPIGIITQDVIRIRVNINIVTPEFIQFWFNSLHGSKALASIIVEGTRMRFGLGDLKKVCIVIPELKLQKQFANRMQVIEKQKDLALANLTKSESLFNSLLQRALKGELTS